VATPMSYFAAHHLGTQSSTMVTGSHNPPDYNGLKMVINGDTLSGEAIQSLRRRLESDDVRRGSGTYVVGAGALSLPPGREGSALVHRLVERSAGPSAIVDLSISVLHDASRLPAVTLTTRELATVDPDTGYSPWGLTGLRAAVADHVTGWGLPTSADEIVITTGAQQGISATTNDFKTYHSSTTSENNIWYQFQIVSRDGYLKAGKRLVDLLVARGDPRLALYFDKNQSGGYAGKDPGQAFDNTTSNICCGQGNAGSRLDPAFQQPLITWAENQLIIAEAAYQTGDPTTALNSLNAERTAAGLPTLSGITGTALRDSIMTEKYVVTFQNIEAWSDYRRTCTPALVPYTVGGATAIPGRLFYGFDERNTNPNIPDPATQQAATNKAGTPGGTNPNDPTACP